MKQRLGFLFTLKGIFVFSVLFSTLGSQEVFRITGRVIDTETEQPLEGVNIVSGRVGTSSNSEGYFELEIPTGTPITVSMVGYASVTVTPPERSVTIRLSPIVLKGEEILVLANRAIPGVTPVAFSTLTPEEIDQHYTVEDVPMILSREPGVHAYSESGSGTGYSYVSIRGFDQSRISVMLDNVPLNDNESHQVYWVDHGDILSNARDVQIQRGVGNSLYGSAAFGGSINVITQIGSEERKLSASLTGGSFDARKYRTEFNSGRMLGENLSLAARVSQISSDGYRDFHESLQRSVFLGVEHRGSRMTNQFRANVGYENTDLLWDGIDASDINDRKLRRIGYKSYTDDFLQQIYSLNTVYRFAPELIFHNVAYLVRGSGYYEVAKTGRDFYSYNLDVDDKYSSEQELQMKTDLLRRKWIVNRYYGLVPTGTWLRGPLRLDMGGEIRFYRGDHFGEVSSFSDKSLKERFGRDWHKYYQYIGSKVSFTGFAHVAYSLTNRVKLVGDVQYQGHRWNLDQKKIGHATGHQLAAVWDFLNPRLGFIYGLNDHISFFGNYGKAQKEPADDQIIEADDVWSEPVLAAAEIVNDLEFGGNYVSEKISGGMNVYRIVYDNEQLKNIDIEQEGEYDYYSADGTVHQGVEFELAYDISPSLRLSANAAVSTNYFDGGDYNSNFLPNVPGQLMNAAVRYRPLNTLTLFGDVRYVGKLYIDNENTEEGIIESFAVANVGLRYRIGPAVLQFKVRNALDTLYSTFGYGYEWDGYWAFYWPGATRNYYGTLTVLF